MFKVYLTGRDNCETTFDDEYHLTYKALSQFCSFVSLREAEIIHSTNWHSLLFIPPEILKAKIVQSHVGFDVKNMLIDPDYLKIHNFIDNWIVMSSQAKYMMQESGFKANYVPYAIDTNNFFPLDKNDKQVQIIHDKYKIPANVYLIGYFQKDTQSFGLKNRFNGVFSVFLEIIKKLYITYKDICIVLTGSCKHLINQLERNSIPYVYIEGIAKDKVNKTYYPPNTFINKLYNLIDVYVVSTLIDLPAILECAATKCKIISADIGLARDILPSECIYSDPIEGFKLIKKDIKESFLASFLDENYNKILNHKINKISDRWKYIYTNLQISKKNQASVMSPYLQSKLKRLKLSKKPTITILHKFHKPPWGGGNQFLMALKKSMENKNYNVTNKFRILSVPDMCIFNSFTFDFSLLNRKKTKNTLMVHRVDGPTVLIRGKDKELDDKVFELNNKVADITVFQSYWSYKKTLELGYEPVNPVIIPNAADSSIFNKSGRVNFNRHRKIKIAATSWSDNPRKGHQVYKWLEENLDWNKYEFGFIGRSQIKFEKLKHIPPLSSKELANVLRQYDIYITASQNDPCSNALIEALSCGLPAIYLNDGGHPELVGNGGLGFNSETEILDLLDKIVTHYENYQNLINVSSIDEISDRYLKLMELMS